MRTILRASALAAAVKCASTEPARPQLNGVHVAPDGTVTATDGHCLLRISPEPGQAGQAEEYPQRKGDKGGDAIPAAGIILPASLAAEAVKLSPRKAAVPLLADHVQLSVRGKGEDVELAGTDLDTWRALQAKCVDGMYPQVEQVIPKATARGAVALDIDLLANMLAAMKAAGVPGGEGYGVILEFRGPLTAVVIRSRTQDLRPVYGLMMPLRNTDVPGVS